MESEAGAVEAAEVGGLGGGAREGAEAEVDEGAAAAAASGCEGGGASILFALNCVLRGASYTEDLFAIGLQKLRISKRTSLKKSTSFHFPEEEPRPATACLQSPDTNRWAKAGRSRGNRTGRAAAAARRTSATTICLHQPTTRRHPSMRTPLMTTTPTKKHRGTSELGMRKQSSRASGKRDPCLPSFTYTSSPCR